MAKNIVSFRRREQQAGSLSGYAVLREETDEIRDRGGSGFDPAIERSARLSEIVDAVYGRPGKDTKDRKDLKDSKDGVL